MISRKIRIIFLALLMFVLLIGCRSSESRQLPKIVIGCDNYKPYSYSDEFGERTGIDTDIAREACKRMGYEPEFKTIDWNKREEYLENGDVDCLWSGCSMGEENEGYEWVGPYMYGRQVVAVLNDSPIKTISDLNGKNIAVRDGENTEYAFLNSDNKNIPNVKNVYCMPTMEEIAMALRNNYVDACSGHSERLKDVFETAGISYRFLDFDLSRAEFGIAFKAGNDSGLKDELDSELKKMRSDGTIKKILNKYGLTDELNLTEVTQ